MSDIAEAASVLLSRGPGSSEVYVVRRAESLRVFGGFIAFPGGRASPPDAELLPGLSAVDPRRVAAARELFEETGVLLARRADGSFPSSGPELDTLRHELSAGRLEFIDVLGRLGLTLRSDDFTPAGRLITPPFALLRFDTSFFVACVPPEQQPVVWPGELDEGWWTTADELLRRWTTGDCLVSPPTVSILEALRGGTVEELPVRLAPHQAALESGQLPLIFFAPAVQMVPLRTMSLPPSTHTNAYLVGHNPMYLLDPGPADPQEQRLLFEVVDGAQAAGRKLAAVILTHHHPDHVGAAAACVERYGVPVWAHPWTANALRPQLAVSRLLDDGDRVELGTAPDGSDGWHWRAIHTPGHAPGHLAFYDPHYRLLFAADMVSTLSSIIIAPPEGDLAVYLASLRRLLTFEARLLLPAHGRPTAKVRETLEEAIAHRLKREEMLLTALGATPRTIAALAAELYKGLPPSLGRLAELQVLAGLQKLQREGRAEPAGDGWRLI